jgi:hypothetical protein
MGTDIYFLCGQGDAATSPGIVSMAVRARAVPDARVRIFYWNDWQEIIADAASRKDISTRLAVSYSLGANALTWVLGGVVAQGIAVLGVEVKFDWAAFIDPTTLSNVTPLGANLGAALHFHNNSLDPVGHASLVAGSGFSAANLEVVETYLPHLTLDVDSTIQGRIMDEINRRTT